MRRRTITRARLQTEEVAQIAGQTGRDFYVDLVTFTYAPGQSWQPRHIRECMDAYRKQAARDGVDFRYEFLTFIAQSLACSDSTSIGGVAVESPP
jgi:hypothetical protein